jgi:hypothetical protein
MTDTTSPLTAARANVTLGDMLGFAVLATGVLLAVEVVGAANAVARVTGRIRRPKRWVKIRASARSHQSRAGS